MTICIAAIGTSNNGKEIIVFATDHMVSTNQGEFEHSILKYEELNDKTVGMISGDALMIDKLFDINKATSYGEIMKQINENFVKLRREVIEKELFQLYGINWDFFKESLQKPIPNPFINMILEKVSKFSLNTEVLLIGFSNSGKAMINTISEGISNDFKRINFHAIGSGTDQAVNTLLFQEHSKDDNVSVTIYNVFKAKKNAEVSQGVGKNTELLILDEEGVRKIPPEDLKVLEEVYSTELNYGKENDLLKGLNILNKNE